MATTLRMSSGGGTGGGGEPPPPDEPEASQATVPLLNSAGAAPHGRPMCPVCNERFSRGSRFCAFDGTILVDAPEESHTDPLIGQVVGGKYTVTRPIGEGGMGTVYEVRHTTLDRKFALKVLRPEIAQNAEHMQRFLQEAKAAAAIGHPNIVSVSDFGEMSMGGKTVPFFVMEFLRGTSLAALLKAEKTLPAKRAARIIAGCADALGAAHTSGVIHRDLKPDNIFLSGENGGDIKVLDFGVAKMQGAARLTKIGMVFGTPHYMSPEQARGQTIDHRADIYALGVILYECLSGHVPFEADTSMGVLTKQIFANPEPIDRVAPDPGRLGALGSIVMRCLAKEPEDRYASMAELADALRQFQSDPAAAADALSSSHKHKALRLREDAAMPRPAQLDAGGDSEAEPEARDLSRLVIYAAAGIAVLGLLIVSARALLANAAAPDAASVTPAGAAPASAAPSAAETAAVAPAPSAAASSEAAAAPSAAPSEAAAASSASMAPASTAARPAASASTAVSHAAAASAAPAKSAAPSGIVDPWSTKKTPKPPGVLDPWAPKKK